VRYLEGHDSHDEWVYNRADIDASAVVWARDMGEAKNQELLRYFTARGGGGREPWLLTESGNSFVFDRYSSARQ
jgi:hypothetical protein